MTILAPRWPRQSRVTQGLRTQPVSVPGVSGSQCGTAERREERQLRVEERPFSIDEAMKAKEAFITSASSFVQPVVSIDGKTVANGKPGPVATRLREIYVDFAKATGT